MSKKYTYYNERLNELEILYKSSNSETFKNIISTAIENTRNSIITLEKVENITINYLKEYVEKYNERHKSINEHVDLINRNISLLNKLDSRTKEEDTLYEYYINHIPFINDKISLEKKVMELNNQVCTNCFTEIEKTLLEFIFKQSNKVFKYDIIMDLLNYISTKLIPGLKEVKAIPNLHTINKKKQFTKTGDKMLIYLEQYIYVLESWNELSLNYIDLLEN